MKKIIFLLALCSLSLHSFSQCNSNAPVTYTITPTAPNEIYITNASAKGWKGGDILLIPAGTYSVIEIDSFGGDPCRDIIIRNTGGQVIVNGPMRFGKDVHYVKIIGDGIAGMYGFKCSSFSFGRVSHWTMRRIECGPNPNGVGIYGKQAPDTTNPATLYPRYVNNKILIDSCYVHDTEGEGMYIGDTAPDFDPYEGAIPQRGDSTTISNNIVTNTGWDGIQLSNSRDGCAIFNNTVSNFGIRDIDGQRCGIISGGNTNCQVYNNSVTNGTGNGIEFFGYGVMNCYNNTISNVGNTVKNIRNGVSVGEESIFGAAYGNLVESNPRQAMVIYNNLFTNPKQWGAIRFNDNNNSALVNLHDNKFCFPSPPPANWKSLYIALQAGYTDINNILSCGVIIVPPPVKTVVQTITLYSDGTYLKQ